MRKTFISLSIIGTLLIYLAFSFMKWEFNPGMWVEEARGIFVFISIGWILIAAMSTPLINDLKK